MRQQINTKLHEIIEFADDKTKAVLNEMKAHPHYIFDGMFMPGTSFWGAPGIMTRLENSIAALHKAEKMIVPHGKIFVELWSNSSYLNQKMFLTVEKQHQEVDIFTVNVILYDAVTRTFLKPIYLDLMWFDSEVNSLVGMEEEGKGFTVVHSQTEEDTSKIETRVLVLHMMSMLFVTLLINNLKGLEKEVIYTDKINKSRKASKKEPINEHTIIRIGHAYDRSGNRHSINTGRKVSMHFREAHTQMQAHGESWIKANPEEALKKYNTKTHHLVFKEAIIINYEDGVDLPERKPKKVTW